MNTYTTVQGDMWDSIAKKLYGDECMMDLLIMANPEKREVAVFGAGETIFVPPALKSKTEKLEKLPPWRKV